MKAAAQNVLGNWSTGADLTAPLQALTDTARTYLVDNLLPMIGNVLQGIPQVIYGLVPEVVQTGTELLGSLAQGFTQGIPGFSGRCSAAAAFPLRKTCGKMPGSS